MKNIISHDCCFPIYRNRLPGGLEVNVSIKHNPYKLLPNTLFEMAARKNKKRAFLFVSKVLAKHIPVNPLIPQLIGAALARLWMQSQIELQHQYDWDVEKAFAEESYLTTITQQINNKYILTDKTLFIGFAETATALGQALFSSFKGNCNYIHTTRDKVLEASDTFKFAEEHSHAPEQHCYVKDVTIFKEATRIVLI